MRCLLEPTPRLCLQNCKFQICSVCLSVFKHLHNLNYHWRAETLECKSFLLYFHSRFVIRRWCYQSRWLEEIKHPFKHPLGWNFTFFFNKSHKSLLYVLQILHTCAFFNLPFFYQTIRMINYIHASHAECACASWWNVHSFFVFCCKHLSERF